MTATRFPSVPLADDPVLAGHALWNDEIAEDLELMQDARPAMPKRVRECPCGLVTCFGDRGCPCGEMSPR
jgi:hypothetical protein